VLRSGQSVFSSYATILEELRDRIRDAAMCGDGDTGYVVCDETASPVEATSSTYEQEREW
jgi:hypothetical protein